MTHIQQQIPYQDLPIVEIGGAGSIIMDSQMRKNDALIASKVATFETNVAMNMLAEFVTKQGIQKVKRTAVITYLMTLLDLKKEEILSQTFFHATLLGLERSLNLQKKCMCMRKH